MIKKCFPDAKLLLKAGKEEKHKLYKSTAFNSLRQYHLLLAGVRKFILKMLFADEASFLG